MTLRSTAPPNSIRIYFPGCGAHAKQARQGEYREDGAHSTVPSEKKKIKKPKSERHQWG